MKQLIKINNIITMKKLFVIAALALGVIGCSKMETSEIMPISFDSETGVDLFSDDHGTASSLLEQNGFDLGERPGDNGIWVAGEGAVVINDKAVIDEVVKEFCLESKISDGLENYSLLVGYAVTGNTGGYEVSQCVKTTDGVSLCLRVEQVGGGWCIPGYEYFMALYPKLPSGPVARIYRTDVDADPGSGDSAE